MGRDSVSRPPASTPIALALAFIVFSPATGWVQLACNSVVLVEPEGLRFGRNLDGPFEHGYWIVNPRGAAKTAYLPQGSEGKPVTWTATYGSLTMAAYHVDMPVGGMNEVGLVLEHLAVASKYPPPDDRPAITPHQWIQYQLDMCGSVEDVLASDPQVRLDGWVFECMHYIVGDASGALAVIEYLADEAGKSERRVYTLDQMPEHMTAVGNAPYSAHVRYMERFAGFGGDEPIPTDRASFKADTRNRFAYSAQRLRDYEAGPDVDPVEYVFETLDASNWGKGTPISLVYLPSSGTIHFKTCSNSTIRTLVMGDFDLAAGAPRLGLYWHEAIDGADWETDITGINNTLVDAFCECRAFGAFRRFADELRAYSAEREEAASGPIPRRLGWLPWAGGGAALCVGLLACANRYRRVRSA
jgi:hypothetical protein